MRRRGKRAVTREEATPAVEVDVPAVPEVEVNPAPVDPLAPVRVRNNGARDWSGSDYAAVGRGLVPAGGEGVVTRKKAAALLAGAHTGAGLGVGPFEIVGE